MKRALLIFLILLVIGLSACGEKQQTPADSENGSSNVTETAPEKTAADAKALIEECRFDEAYELLLALKGDPDADKLLECFIEFPNFTIDYPEEEYVDDYFEVKGSGEDTFPIVTLSFNLAPYTDDEADGIEDYYITYDEKGRISRFSANINANLNQVIFDYEYSKEGVLSKVTVLQTADYDRAPKNNNTIELDQEGKPVRIFSDKETVLYTYKDGLLAEKQVQDNYHAYHYEYIYENGQIASVNKNGKLDISYEYDEKGRILSVQNKSDAAGSKRVVYETDENGTITRTETYGNGSIRKYDQNGSLTYYEGPTEGYGNLEYDEAGRLVCAEWSVNYEKKKVELSYDESGRIREAVVTKNDRSIKYIFTEFKAYYIPDANIREALEKELCFGAKRIE